MNIFETLELYFFCLDIDFPAGFLPMGLSTAKQTEKRQKPFL
jgi:hypothetical protein